MKTVAFAMYFAFLPAVLFARSPQPSTANGNNLYAAALDASITEMERDWGHIDDSNGFRIRTDYRHMLVEKDREITDELPSKFGDRSVEYLDNQALIDRYKRLKKPFAVLKISPIRNEGDTLLIHVTVYWFSYRKHRLLFGLSDWSDVEFRYDCDRRRYIITSVKLGGI